MTDQRISQLTAASTLTVDDLIPVVQSGTTKQASLSALPFLPSGSGAVARTVQSKLRELFASPEDFGAVGDDSTDDCTKIQAAVDALAAAGGGTLMLAPYTTYKLIADGVVLPRSPVVNIVGAGNASLLHNATTGGDAIKWETGVTSIVSKQKLADFKITCDAGSRHGIYMNNEPTGNGFRWAHFSNLNIEGADVASSVGFNLEFVVNSTFQNLTVRDFDTDIKLRNVNGRCAANTWQTGITLSAVTANWDLDDVRGDTYIQCRAEGTAPSAFKIASCERLRFFGGSTEDDHSTADWEISASSKLGFYGTECGTNTTGDGWKLTNVDGSSWFGGGSAAHAGGGKFCVLIDSASRGNRFVGFQLPTAFSSDVSDSGTYTIWDTTATDNASPTVEPFRMPRSISYPAQSPAQITATQNNYNGPAGSWWRVTTDASQDIRGIQDGVDGRVIKITNVGSFDVVLVNEHASATAANRIITGTGASVTLTPDDSAELRYDSTTARWRIVSVYP